MNNGIIIYVNLRDKLRNKSVKKQKWNIIHKELISNNCISNFLNKY